jgi:RimJ/RimL family protein N-acetyltransferase/8-oxo-dGTP pyrophosphatase MutT (NUDIX family)
MEYFSGILTKEESDLFAKRICKGFQEQGWGLWAVSIPHISDFIGYIGLVPVNFIADFTPAVEVGWRLARQFWGKGYATEGAKEALKYGFNTLGLNEIVSFTSMHNMRSRRVMDKIGMYHDEKSDFDHPKLPKGHKLRRNVLYRIQKDGTFTHVWESPPDNFQPYCEVVACYVEINNKILLLEYSLSKSEGKTWGVPAGRIEKEERPIDAALRELFEETGITASSSQVKAIGKLYIQKQKGAYIFHMFQVYLNEIPNILLSEEHTRYLWADSHEIEKLPLIDGAKGALNYFARKKRV